MHRWMLFGALLLQAGMLVVYVGWQMTMSVLPSYGGAMSDDLKALQNARSGTYRVIDQINREVDPKALFLVLRPSDFAYYCRNDFISYFSAQALPIFQSRSKEEVYGALIDLNIDYVYLPNYYGPEVFKSHLDEVLSDHSLAMLVYSVNGVNVYRIYRDVKMAKEKVLAHYGMVEKPVEVFARGQEDLFERTKVRAFTFIGMQRPISSETSEIEIVVHASGEGLLKITALGEDGRHEIIENKHIYTTMLQEEVREYRFVFMPNPLAKAYGYGFYLTGGASSKMDLERFEVFHLGGGTVNKIEEWYEGHNCLIPNHPKRKVLLEHAATLMGMVFRNDAACWKPDLFRLRGDYSIFGLNEEGLYFHAVPGKENILESGDYKIPKLLLKNRGVGLYFEARLSGTGRVHLSSTGVDEMVELTNEPTTYRMALNDTTPRKRDEWLYVFRKLRLLLSDEAALNVASVRLVAVFPDGSRKVLETTSFKEGKIW